MQENTLGGRGRVCLNMCADACAAGPIQCSPGVTPYWKGCERFPKVLDGEATKD